MRWSKPRPQPSFSVGTVRSVLDVEADLACRGVLQSPLTYMESSWVMRVPFVAVPKSTVQRVVFRIAKWNASAHFPPDLVNNGPPRYQYGRGHDTSGKLKGVTCLRPEVVAGSLPLSVALRPSSLPSLAMSINAPPERRRLSLLSVTGAFNRARAVLETARPPRRQRPCRGKECQRARRTSGNTTRSSVIQRMLQNGVS